MTPFALILGITLSEPYHWKMSFSNGKAQTMLCQVLMQKVFLLMCIRYDIPCRLHRRIIIDSLLASSRDTNTYVRSMRTNGRSR